MGDGEDGPTHQPVEHLASRLRAIPGLVTLRPGDANEVVEAYRYIMQLRHKPAVLALSRQPLPTLDRSKYAPRPEWRAAPTCWRCSRRQPRGDPHRHGQRSQSRVDAHEKLLAEGIRSRVVSMPSWDIFEHQTQEYRDSVLPPAVKARVAIEQAPRSDGSATSAVPGA
jgi:transketolase